MEKDQETLDQRATTVSPSDAAERLGLTVGTLANLRYRGGGPAYIRVGNRIRYRLSDLATWLDARVRKSTTDEGTDV